MGRELGHAKQHPIGRSEPEIALGDGVCGSLERDPTIFGAQTGIAQGSKLVSKHRFEAKGARGYEIIG